MQNHNKKGKRIWEELKVKNIEEEYLNSRKNLS